MKYLIEGIEMNLYSCSTQQGKVSYWVGMWSEDRILHTHYLGIDDGSRENDPRLKYRRLTKEPYARRGTLWLFFQGKRLNLRLEVKYSQNNKRGKVFGPYFYWYGYWYEQGKTRRHYFGRNLPADCEIIEGDAPDTESGYEEAPIDGFLAFLVEAETE